MEDGEAGPGWGASPGWAGAPGLGRALPSKTRLPERAAARLFCHVQSECGGRGVVCLTPRRRYLGKVFWHRKGAASTSFGVRSQRCRSIDWNERSGRSSLK